MYSYLRTRANTCAFTFQATKNVFSPLRRLKKFIITFFLFTEFDSMYKNITMLKKLPDHFKKQIMKPIKHLALISTVTLAKTFFS